jgi:signal transduction histidine kinase
MRSIFVVLLLGIWIPALSQRVLTITDARKDNPIERYTLFLEDSTYKLTFEEVVHLPEDSFRAFRSRGAFNATSKSPAVWLKFDIENQTHEELFLKSIRPDYHRLDVFVLDKEGKLTKHQLGTNQLPSNRPLPVAYPVIPLGRHPRHVYIVSDRDVFNGYLRVSNSGYTLLERRRTGFWQGIVVGTSLLLLVYAVVFWFRLRHSILGWFALFLLTNIHWFLYRSGYFNEFLELDSIYFDFSRYYPPRIVYSLCWAVFHIKFLQLKKYSKLLYNLLVGWLGLDVLNHLCIAISTLFGAPFAPLDIPLSWVGIDWAGKLIITLLMLLISLIYVCRKNFREVRLYALGLGFGVTAMLVSLFALYNISWLPFFPFNYTFVIGSVVEMVIFAYAIAEQHQRKQNQTQQQLIAQLQENLRQRNKLLRIRDEIARDLHDEVGATLTSIAISTKLAQKKVSRHQADIEPILAQIKADSEESIHSIRDTVWALNPDNDAPAKFLERLRTVALQMLANQGITLIYDCEVDPELLPSFSMEQRRNIYLVFKEAVHNIIKHAQANKVSIQIRRSDGHLQVNISDNGRGFNSAVHAEGNGLIKFQKRAGEGGFTVRIQSEAGTGTTILMQVPIQEAAAVAINWPLSL